MKKFLLALAVAAAAILTPISSAKAECPGQMRVIAHCGRCDRCIHQRWQAVGNYCDGCPIYGWVTLPHQCSAHHHHSDHHHSSHHHSHHHCH